MTEAVYNCYRRTGWTIDDNDQPFFDHEIQRIHQGIITAEVFQKVQSLNGSRAIDRSSQPKKYPLSQKMKCGECGSTFRHTVANNKVYWICRRHYTKGNMVCKTQQISETKIYNAFITLCNKLKISYHRILIPMLEQLQLLKASRNQSNTPVCEINKEMANLTEQNHVLSGPKSKGYIDSALFLSRTNDLNRKIAKLKADKTKLVDSDDDNIIVDTQSLIESLDHAPDYHCEFEPSIFESVATRIIISNGQIKFHLINGLDLNETTER